MNTNDIKIVREALYWINGHVSTIRGAGWGTAQEKIRAIDAALDRLEAHQQPKRLTNNMVTEEIIKYDDLLEQNTDIAVDVRLQMGTAYGAGMRHARDNGHLGGLSVEEVMEVIALYFFERHATAIGHKGSPIYDDFRARLTAKANGTNK